MINVLNLTTRASKINDGFLEPSRIESRVEIVTLNSDWSCRFLKAKKKKIYIYMLLIGWKVGV